MNVTLFDLLWYLWPFLACLISYVLGRKDGKKEAESEFQQFQHMFEENE